MKPVNLPAALLAVLLVPALSRAQQSNTLSPAAALAPPVDTTLQSLQSPMTRIDVPRLALSFELPGDWVPEEKEGTLTYHPPGDAPEAILSFQMIDNTVGTSRLADQVTKLKGELEGLPGLTFLSDEEEEFAGQPGHLLIGRFQTETGPAQGMLWQIVSRSQYFYWIGMTFPPDKWQGGYAVLMDRLNSGFRFTPLHRDSAKVSDSVAANFLREIRQGLLDEAFERTSGKFQQITPGPAFRQFVEGQAILGSFPWFRVLDNTGTADLRRLSVEFGGGAGAAVPFAFLDLERSGPSDWRIGSFYLTEGQRVPVAGENSTRAGFAKVSIQKAGFSGSFPEHWIMLPEELPDNILRIVFRPPGGGLKRNHQAIILTIRPQASPLTGPLAEGLDAYLSAFSGSPGYQRAENYESSFNGLPAAGTTFRSEIEDDSGHHVAANVVTVLRSAAGAVAILHIILDSDGLSEGFDTQVAPVLEDFRFLE